MDVKRRDFLKGTLAAGVALLTGAWTFIRTAPRRIVYAARGHSYPGTVTDMNESDITHPGSWAG